MEQCDPNAVEGSHLSDAHEIKPVEVERNAGGGDRDAMLADHASNVASEVIRAGLGDLI